MTLINPDKCCLKPLSKFRSLPAWRLCVRCKTAYRLIGIPAYNPAYATRLTHVEVEEW